MMSLNAHYPMPPACLERGHHFHALLDHQNGRRHWHCLRCGITPIQANELHGAASKEATNG